MNTNIPETIVLIYSILENAVGKLQSRELMGYKPHVDKWYNTYPDTFKNENVLRYLQNRSLRYFTNDAGKPLDTFSIHDNVEYKDAVYLVNGIYYIYLVIMYKSSILKEYDYKINHLIEDLVVAMLLHKTTNELLLINLQNNADTTKYTEIYGEFFTTTYKAVTGVDPRLDYNMIADLSKLNNLCFLYAEYNITKDKIIKGLSIYSISMAMRYKSTNRDNTTSDFGTVLTDNKITTLNTTPSKVTLIDSIINFFEHTLDNFLIYVETDNKAVSVKDMFNILFNDIQSFNCLDPKDKQYDKCVERRSTNRVITEYSDADLLQLLNNPSEEGPNINILNISSLPDNIFYANQDYIKNKDTLVKNKVARLKEWQDKATNVKALIVNIMAELITKRKEYILTMYNKDYIKYIEDIYQGNTPTDKELDKVQCEIILNTYNKDIIDIMQIIKVICKDVLSEYSKE